MINGDITKKNEARKMALVEYLEFDSYKRWLNYNEYLNRKK